jgi:hypothetical protein
MNEIDNIISNVYKSYLTADKQNFDLYYELHLKIAEYVNNNTNEENIKIINDYNKVFNNNTIINNFYSNLAYNAIRYNTNIFERIKYYINDDNI